MWKKREADMRDVSVHSTNEAALEKNQDSIEKLVNELVQGIKELRKPNDR